MSHEVYSGHAVKRAAWQFLTGKAASALLTFIILLWLVRLMPVAEYGAYVVLIAGTEVGFGVAGLGLPWLAARYLPDYRLHANGLFLTRLCQRLALWQGLALVVLAAVIVFILDAYLRWADLSDYRTAAWFALGLLVAEGLGRFLREGLMAPLMLQGQVRLSLILRQLSFLVAIAVISFIGKSEASWVLAMELGAALLGWLVAAIALAHHLHSLRAQAAKPDWIEPQLADQWRIALRMHVSVLMSLTYSSQVFLNLVQRHLGAEAAALFGFLLILYRQVFRYLPATLLFTVLRPKLMTSYLQGGIKQLAQLVNLTGKLSLLVLLPLIVLIALGGDVLLSLLSDGKFQSGVPYLLGLMLILVPYSQQQLMETVAVAVGRAGLCSFGSALGLLALPLILFLFDFGFGLWAPVLAMLGGQFVFNATVLTGLVRIGYQMDWRGTAGLVASTLLAWLAASGVLVIEHNLIWLGMACLLALIVFLGTAWWLQVFTAKERQRLNDVLGLRIFPR